MLPNSKRPSQLKARQRSLSQSASDLPPTHSHPSLPQAAAAASPGQLPPPPPTAGPHNEGPLPQTSPAFASPPNRKTASRTSSGSVTSLLTSPPIPEIGGKAHGSAIAIEADLDDDEDESKKLRQSLLGSPRSQSFRIGNALRSNSGSSGGGALSSSFTKAYPNTATSASRGRILLLSSLGVNLLCILWASNQHFLSGLSQKVAKSDCQTKVQAQIQSCDIKGRSMQQLCGVGMMQHMWHDNRSSRLKGGNNATISTGIIADPTCSRSAGVFDMANHQRNRGTRRVLTFALLYYEEPLYLSHQIASWLQWSKETRGKFNFLIVDDGSRSGLKAADFINDPEMHAKIMDSKMDLEIYEVQEDICWNIAGARNLAVFMAKTEYLYLGDADTIVENGTAQYMLVLKHEDEAAFRSGRRRSLYYQFDRIRSDGITRKPHPAVMLLSKSTYWTAGGGDEDGMFTSGKFRQRAKWAGLNIAKMDHQMAKNNIPPLRELDDATPCPNHNANDCNAMVKFKKDNTLPRPGKPEQEEYWQMKFNGQKPWSNEYLRFSWKMAFSSR